MSRNKRNRKRKGININLIIFICFLFLFAVGIIYAQVSQTLSLTGTVRVIEQIKKDDTTITYVSHQQEGTTETGIPVYRYLYTYTITNNSEKTTTGWKVLIYNLPTTTNYVGVWDSVVVKEDFINGKVALENAAWNGTIAAGETKQFNFSFIANELIDVNQLKIKIYTAQDDTQPEDTPLESITLDKNSETLNVGETLALTATKKPANALETLTWTSSNETIAKVTQDGVITAINAGTVDIKVSSGDISAICKITVTQKETKPEIGDKIKVTFTKSAAWANSIQFTLKVENISDTKINSWSFRLGMPEGSNYTLWSGNFLNTSTNVASGTNLESGTSVSSVGQVDLPEGYNINDYFEPIIYELTVN